VPERRRAPPSAIEVARLRCRRCVGTPSSTALAQLVRQPFPRSVRLRPGGAAPREDRAEPHRDPRPQLHRVRHERSRHPNARRRPEPSRGASSTPSTCWSRTGVRIYCIGGGAARAEGAKMKSIPGEWGRGPKGPKHWWRRRESNPGSLAPSARPRCARTVALSGLRPAARRATA
jgi:hypothetical protein